MAVLSNLLFLTACTGPYSILDPAGPSASEAAWLWWFMFALFGIVMISVVALWLYAMNNNPERKITEDEAQLIQTRWIIGGGIALPVVSILIILFFGIPAGHRMLPLPQGNGEVFRIDVTGRQWEWNVHYPNENIDLKDELHIPAGIPVDIHLKTEDVIHSFWVPRLGGKLDTIPGRENVLRLQADKAGLYHGQCAEYCGLNHTRMKFTVTAHTPEDYAVWVEEMKNE